MEVITISTFKENVTYYAKKIENWAIFVYPTDTIYGIWWIVTPEVIKKIDTIKQRKSWKYYSIIAPSFRWIESNFDVKEGFQKKRENLVKQHGPLTLLLPLKDSDELIWVRMINHPLQQFVAQLGQAIITTSVNVSWEASITHPSKISSSQQENIDFAIDNWPLTWSWSTIINYVTWEKIR